jgi:hypothetical protein
MSEKEAKKKSKFVTPRNPSHLDDNHICLRLKVGLDKDLQAATCDAKAHDENDLHP